MTIDDPTPRRVSALHIELAKRRQATDAAIKDGQLPSLAELYTGSGFAGSDWKLDCRLWCRDLLLDTKLEEFHDRIKHLHDACSLAALNDCRDALENERVELADRIDFYLAANQDRLARQRVAIAALDSHFGRPDHRRVAFGIGVARSSVAVLKPHLEVKSTENIIKSAAADIQMAEEARHVLDSGGIVQSAEDQLQDRLALVLEDRAEVDLDDADQEPEGEGMVVVPMLPLAHGTKLTINKSWFGIAGERLPVIRVDDIAAALAIIEAEMPHARDLAMRMAMTLQPGRAFKLAPTLFVGEPGTGKTTLARLLARAFGLPSETHNLGGAADASIGGTSSQYSTARESSFLQQIKRERIANPIAILDEIEKASPSRHNGSALDVILPLLETHTASRYRDPALEVEVDLSGITILATANSLEGIPAPLRDRFTIHRMPEPGWQHVGVLSRNILDRIAKERGLDPRWFPDFAGDEMQVIERNWTGGSIRRLERIVRILVDGRDRLLGQA